MFSLCGIHYGIHVSNWIDSESRNTAQVCDVWIVRIHYKVVRCRCKVEREDTYFMFYLSPMEPRDSILLRIHWLITGVYYIGTLMVLAID
jgi:hypothetical protein